MIVTMDNDKKMKVNMQAMQRLGEEAEQSFAILSYDDIVMIHDEMVKMFGGSLGVRDVGLLESVCLSPYQSMFGQDLYPTIIDKAAKYAFDFANYQIFIDGNKRCGLATMTAFLNINGYDLTLSSEQQYFLMMNIANKVYVDSRDVAFILQDHVRFIDKEAELECEM